MQNPMDLLDIEKRTGVKNVDIDDFVRRATDIESAIKDMAAGKIKPEDVKIDGIDTPEEEAKKAREKAERLAESRRKAEELRLKRKAQEKERWWDGAEFCGSRKVRDVEDNVIVNVSEREEGERERIKQRYAADYSRWNDWTPTDEATVEEAKRKEEEEDAIKNAEFEKNNAEWCNQFTEDMEARNKSMAKKKATAEALRLKGNKRFQRKDWDGALEQYMESLKLQPYDTKTLTNIAQAYIKQKNWDDSLEFLERALYLDFESPKALSRKAFVLSEQGQVSEAVAVAGEALSAVQRIHGKDSSAKEVTDIATQLHDLKVLCKEKSSEDRLRQMLEGVAAAKKPPAVPDENAAAAPTTSDIEAGEALPAAKAPLTKKSVDKMTDFEAVDQLSGVLGDLQAADPIASNDVTPDVLPVSSAGDKDISLSILRDVMLRMEKNQMVKVYLRTQGLLSHCVDVVGQRMSRIGESAAASEVTMLETLLHLLATAIQGERAAKLLLLPDGKTEFLSGLRDHVLPLSAHPSLVFAAVRVLYACCNDDTCAKTRDWVCSDALILHKLAASVGEAVSNLHQAPDPAATPFPNFSKHGDLTVQGLVETAASLVKTITFSTFGQNAIRKASPECGALLLLANFTNMGRSNEKSKMETVQTVTDALLGCSQVEELRVYFSGEIPWGQQIHGSGGKSASEKAPSQVCVEIIVHACKALPELASSGLAVLMNACLEGSGEVRAAVLKHGGYDLSAVGFETLSKSIDGSKYTAAEWQLLCRQLGLLSRLSPLPEVQGKLYKPASYHQLCTALTVLTGSSAPAQGSREAELVSHCIRILAALNKPTEECIAAGVNTRIVQTLLNVFPEPRKELGKVTPSSVTFVPLVKVPSILIGNAARCLMPFADSAGAAAILYQDRSLLGVEKLICALATCVEMPVRQNISVLLAKGCRLPGVREVVTEFRGMQIMSEMQSKFKL
eukprot:GSChrysophyteH1.ASY1.ANO1.1337.1 assembled CDS